MTVEARMPKWQPWVVAAGAVGMIGFVRLYEQQIVSVMPPCTLHALTGLYCPGCGATRAVRALLHGHVVAAWNYNQLFVLMLPLTAIFLAQSWWRPRPYRGS